MMISLKRLALALGVLSLVGCAGPPAQHYTLSQASPPQPSSPVTSSKDVFGKSVGAYSLSDISVPAEVDNISLVVSQGDGRLMILSEDRWSGSVSAQLSNAISQALTQRIGMPPVQKLVSEAAGASVTKIQLAVQRFDLIPGRSVALDAVWSMRFPGSKSFLTCYTRLLQPVDIGVIALVRGQQENVQALATQLTEALKTEKAPSGSSCSR